MKHVKRLPVSTPHVRSLGVTVLRKQVKSRPDWKVNNCPRIHKRGEDRMQGRTAARRHGERDRWIEGFSASYRNKDEQKPPWRPVPGQDNLNCKLKNFCTLGMENPEREKLQEDPVRERPPQLWNLPPGAQPGSPNMYWKKILSWFWQGWGGALLLNEARPQEKLLDQKWACWGIIRASPGEVQYPAPGEREKMRNSCEVHRTEARAQLNNAWN